MDALIMFASLLAIGVLVGTSLGHAVGKGRGVIAAFVGMDSEPSWPRGVQEDYAPPMWKLNELSH